MEKQLNINFDCILVSSKQKMQKEEINGLITLIESTNEFSDFNKKGHNIYEIVFSFYCDRRAFRFLLEFKCLDEDLNVSLICLKPQELLIRQHIKCIEKFLLQKYEKRLLELD